MLYAQHDKVDADLRKKFELLLQIWLKVGFFEALVATKL